MKTLRLALAGAVAVVVALFATLGPAFAYPITVNLSVSGGTLVGGKPIEVTAVADSECLELSITYLGETVSAPNTDTFSHTFDTRKVTKVESDPVTADCTFDNGEPEPDALGGGSAGKLGTTLVQVLDNAHAVNTITLLPPSGGDGGGLLPNTGGERLAWLLIGGLLVTVGGGAIVASRRRTS